MNDFNHDEVMQEVFGADGYRRRLGKELKSYADHKELARQMRELHGYDYAKHQAKHDEMWGRTKVALMIFVLGVAFIAGIITAASGADNGQWKDLAPEVRKWFQSPRIAPCCSLADGTRTDWDIKDGGYYVPVPWHPQGREYWERVPDGVVIHDAGNPVGVALIWYNVGGQSIRCFVPGGGV
jgi:hypothetical protein